MGEALVQSQHLDTDTIVVRVRGELDIYTARPYGKSSSTTSNETHHATSSWTWAG